MSRAGSLDNGILLGVAGGFALWAVLHFLGAAVFAVLGMLAFILLLPAYGEKLQLPVLSVSVFVSAAVPYVVQREYYLFGFGDMHFNIADVLFGANLICWAVARDKAPVTGFQQWLVVFLLFLTIPAIHSYWAGDTFYLVRNIRIFAYLLYVVFFCSALKSRRDVNAVLTAFVLGVCANGLLLAAHVSGVYEVAGLGTRLELSEYDRYRIFSMDQFLTVIAFLVSVSLFAMQATWLYFAGSVAGCALLLVSGGRADWIAALLGVAVIVWLDLRKDIPRRSLMFAALGVVLVLALGQLGLLPYVETQFQSLTDPNNPAYGSVTTRWQHVLASADFILLNPLFGSGLGVVLPENLQYEYGLAGERFGSANVWMDLAERAGIVGTSIFAFFVLSVSSALLRLNRSAARPEQEISVIHILIGIWAALMLYFFIGHPILRWQSFGITIGWFLGIVYWMADGKKVKTLPGKTSQKLRLGWVWNRQ